MWPQVKHARGNHTVSNDGNLANETCLFSQNGHFFLKCQGDGKIVLYRAHQPGLDQNCTPYWQNEANQHNEGPFRLAVQNDGNLCNSNYNITLGLYNGQNKCIWSSNTWQQNPKAPYHLTVQHDGNVTYSDNNGHVLWEAKNQHGYQAQPQPRHHVLENDFSLLNEQCLFSPSGTFFAKCQGDGKLAVYQSSQQFSTNNATFKWQNDATQHHDGPFRVAMQGDGNLVIYNAHNQPKWANNGYTQHPVGPYSLHMQDDGNLVVYDKNGAPKWALW